MPHQSTSRPEGAGAHQRHPARRGRLRSDIVFLSGSRRAGGHPPPEIGLRFDGKPFATKDFRVWRNTFTFIAKSEDNGKKIECTATNKVGSANSVSELNVLSE